MAWCLKKEVVCFVFGAALAFTLILFVNNITNESIDKIRMLSSGNKYLATVFTAPLVDEDRSTVVNTETNKHLNIFNATNESKEIRDSVSKNKCIPYKTRSGDAQICVHPEKDSISRYLLKSGQWEGNYIDIVANAVTKHPGMSFLDIGCNIGAYTVYLAKMGTRVVGVDVSKESLLLLSRALNLGKLQQNVTLILNAMSDKHEYVALEEIAREKGARFVIPSKDNAKGAIPTILLDELAFMFSGQSLFIKMDIEGSEWKTLNGGKQFFETVDVRYVLMEFIFHRRHNGKPICNFFTENGFRPYKPLERSSVLNMDQYESWPQEVLWIKEH